MADGGLHQVDRGAAVQRVADVGVAEARIGDPCNTACRAPSAQRGLPDTWTVSAQLFCHLSGIIPRLLTQDAPRGSINGEAI